MNFWKMSNTEKNAVKVLAIIIIVATIQQFWELYKRPKKKKRQITHRPNQRSSRLRKGIRVVSNNYNTN